MGNPILDMMTRTNTAMESFGKMVGTVQAAKNPMGAISQMAMNNPQMQQVMQVVQQNGGNAQQAFYNMCRQRGVDPNTIISQVQGLMKNNQNGR